MAKLLFLLRDATQTRRARLCDSKSSVCPSVCNVEVFSHRLEYFENNFTAE